MMRAPGEGNEIGGNSKMWVFFRRRRGMTNNGEVTRWTGPFGRR